MIFLCIALDANCGKDGDGSNFTALSILCDIMTLEGNRERLAEVIYASTIFYFPKGIAIETQCNPLIADFDRI